MIYYADSSFLVSSYLQDANSAAARIWLQQNAVQFAYTSFHALEIRNAFQLGLFRKVISAGGAISALSDLHVDLRSGRLIKVPINWPLVMRLAETYSKKYSATMGCRSLDILHVASAKSLRADQFVSFDLRQRSLAAKVGQSIGP